ncbi:MAG TPA: hypothetical protein VMT96_00185 [Candidatus Bathyarchaeia archaeon]|nr:hypothetical protein [Candidatus Bathyarchaeia archaeon]
MKENYDPLASPTNPNGVFDKFIDGSIKEQFPDRNARFMIAIADIKSYLVEVVRLDPEMAEVVAARAATEMGLALDTDLDQQELKECIDIGSELSEAAAVDRAISNILDETDQ